MSAFLDRVACFKVSSETRVKHGRDKTRAKHGAEVDESEVVHGIDDSAGIEERSD